MKMSLANQAIANLVAERDKLKAENAKLLEFARYVSGHVGGTMGEMAARLLIQHERGEHASP